MATRDIYEAGFDESTGKQLHATECPECDGDVRTDGGERSCLECGLILTEYHLDHAATPRSFAGDDESLERTGAPLTETRHDRGLSSEVGRGRDGNGNPLSARKRSQLGRLRREHSRAKFGSKRDRNLGRGCTEIARMASALSLPRSTREDASALFRRAQRDDLLRGRSIESIAAGALYAACRRHGQARTLSEVATVARCSEGKCSNGYRVLNRDLGLAIEAREPPEYVPLLSGTLGVSREIERRAASLACSATDRGLGIGRNPLGVAAGCLAVVVERDGIDLTQKAIASAAEVSTATVRARRDEIRDVVGSFVDGA